MHSNTDLLFEVLGKKNNIGVITLNRPQALNALNLPMIQGLNKRLQEWEKNPAIKVIILQSASSKAFCAGGDVRLLYTEGKNNKKEVLSFFQQEYTLNLYLNNYSKPILAYLNGLTMGGGVGISCHTVFPLATENLTFAMPETAIGLFPDVGGSYVLNRCKGEIGTYLGLTGLPINAADTLYAGIIKYAVASDRLAELTDILLQYSFSANSYQDIDSILRTFHTPLLPAPIVELQPLIDQCFAYDRVEQIIDALTKIEHPWGKETLQTLLTRSPTSLKVTLKLLRLTKNLSLAECLALDFRLINQFLEGHDMFEGIRAKLIDKDNNPQWQPADLAEVSDQEVAQYFDGFPLSRE